MKWFAHNPKETTPEQIRGVPDEKLKFVSTSGLIVLAIARIMESEGVEDQPLIDELYKRGRSEK